MQIHQLIEKLAKIQRAQRFGIYLGVYVLLGLLYYFVLYAPKVDQKAALFKTEEELKSGELKKKASEDEKATLAAAQKSLQAELDELSKMLPHGTEIGAFLKGVSETGNRVGLEVRRFDVIDEIPLPEKFYAEVPVNIEVYGDYHTVARFFDELSRLPRIVYVQDISIGDPETVDEDTMVTVTGQAMTFRSLTADEVAPADKKKGGKKKGGRKGGKKGK